MIEIEKEGCVYGILLIIFFPFIILLSPIWKFSNFISSTTFFPNKIITIIDRFNFLEKEIRLLITSILTSFIYTILSLAVGFIQILNMRELSTYLIIYNICLFITFVVIKHFDIRSTLLLNEYHDELKSLSHPMTFGFLFQILLIILFSDMDSFQILQEVILWVILVIGLFSYLIDAKDFKYEEMRMNERAWIIIQNHPQIKSLYDRLRREEMRIANQNYDYRNDHYSEILVFGEKHRFHKKFKKNIEKIINEKIKELENDKKEKQNLENIIKLSILKIEKKINDLNGNLLHMQIIELQYKDFLNEYFNNDQRYDDESFLFLIKYYYKINDLEAQLIFDKLTTPEASVLSRDRDQFLFYYRYVLIHPKMDEILQDKRKYELTYEFILIHQKHIIKLI